MLTVEFEWNPGYSVFVKHSVTQSVRECLSSSQIKVDPTLLNSVADDPDTLLNGIWISGINPFVLKTFIDIIVKTKTVFPLTIFLSNAYAKI